MTLYEKICFRIVIAIARNVFRCDDKLVRSFPHPLYTYNIPPIFSYHFFLAHFVSFKMIRDIVQIPWVLFNCFNISWVLKWSGRRKNGARLICIASFVIRSIGAKFYEHGSKRTSSSNSFWVLRWSETFCIQNWTDYKGIFTDSL